MRSLDKEALAKLRLGKIGFVFQYHHLIGAFTALENVIFPTAIRNGRETAAARARAASRTVLSSLAAALAVANPLSGRTPGSSSVTERSVLL